MSFSSLLIPTLVCTVLLVAHARGVPVFEVFIQGAEEGLRLAAHLLPYILAIYVALGVFRSSGALGLLTRWLGPALAPLRVPAEILPIILVRPIASGAATSIIAHVLETHGPDSFLGRVASVLQGSSDTTLYVLTLYFGSVGVRRTRYALPLCLIGDCTGFFGAVLITRLLFPR